MRTKLTLSAIGLLFLTSCSPREFLTRRLATDLISASDAFKTPQQFALQTGVVSNKDYVSPEYLVLQQHGWISATSTRCPPAITLTPCWDVLLTPSGVDTIRSLVPAEEVGKTLLHIPVARRELVGVAGISKQGSSADVDSGDLHYVSSVGFREYDDGWRMLQSAPRAAQTIEDALKNAEPAP